MLRILTSTWAAAERVVRPGGWAGAAPALRAAAKAVLRW